MLEWEFPHAPVGIGTCSVHIGESWIWGHLCPHCSIQPWGATAGPLQPASKECPQLCILWAQAPRPALGHESGVLAPTPCLSLVPLLGLGVLSHLPLAMAVASGEAPAAGSGSCSMPTPPPQTPTHCPFHCSPWEGRVAEGREALSPEVSDPCP